MGRRDTGHAQRVMKSGRDSLDLRGRRADKVKAASHEVETRIDFGGLSKNVLHSRVRTSNDHHEPPRRAKRK
jgi:hypothetical protein